MSQDPADYQEWLSSRADRSLATRGRQRFLQFQCVTCHSADSQARAPNLEALYNRPVPLQDGRTVIADENYLRESILNPRAKVVAGYEPIMPTFQGQMQEEELLELLAFIKALRPGETPRRNEESVAPQSDPKAKEPRKFPAANEILGMIFDPGVIEGHVIGCKIKHQTDGAAFQSFAEPGQSSVAAEI